MIFNGKFLNIYTVAGLGVFLAASCRLGLVSSSSPWLYLGLVLVGFILGCSLVLFSGKIKKPPITHQPPPTLCYESHQSTIWEVNAVFREPAGPVKEVFSPEALVEMEKRRDGPPARRKAKGQSDSTDGQFQSTEQSDYEGYRAEATLHFKQSDECFKKAAKAYRAGQKKLASYYSNQGHLHSIKLKEADKRAAKLILDQRKQVTGENKLDLHNLYVKEALQALQKVLIERQYHPSSGQHRYLEVVTGQGRHSKKGVAKLKPAVCKFLKQKGYSFTNANAGCLKVDLLPRAVP